MTRLFAIEPLQHDECDVVLMGLTLNVAVETLEHVPDDLRGNPTASLSHETRETLHAIELIARVGGIRHPIAIAGQQASFMELDLDGLDRIVGEQAERPPPTYQREGLTIRLDEPGRIVPGVDVGHPMNGG